VFLDRDGVSTVRQLLLCVHRVCIAQGAISAGTLTTHIAVHECITGLL
jgi:hypothetical protein